jgi:hypothetical protein
MKNEELDLAVVMTLLRDNGVHYIGCYYSGGGDSGDIESIAIYGPDFKKQWEDEDIEVEWGDSGTVDYSLPDDVDTFMNDLFYSEHLNNIEDWWNNDGGYGSMVMCTETGEFKNINNCYYMQTETFYHEGKVNVE